VYIIPTSIFGTRTAAYIATQISPHLSDKETTEPLISTALHEDFDVDDLLAEAETELELSENLIGIKKQ
jgi:hypothetical protein